MKVYADLFSVLFKRDMPKEFTDFGMIRRGVGRQREDSDAETRR